MAQILEGVEGTFAISTGNVTVSSLDIDMWEAVFDRPITQRRPFGYLLPKTIMGGRGGRIRFRGYQMAGTTAPQPGDQTATSGTCTLTAKSGQTYVFKVLVHRLSTGAAPRAAEANPQEAIYEGVITADSNSDTITVA